MKQITIHPECEIENDEGIFLVNPLWMHLDKTEIKDRTERGERLFKVNVEEAK